VFAFDLFIVFFVLIVFFVFIPDPLHKSRESVKIGPHPGGCPSSPSATRCVSLWGIELSPLDIMYEK
jgi:hypothetical protein